MDADGLHAIDKKVEAIRNAPAPANQQQLRSFLGMVNYYAKFVNNYSTTTHPLHELLHNDAKWKWGKAQQNAFDELKDQLSSAPVLMHYDAELPLKLDTDASDYGVGAVISHILPDGAERPIAYASRTLSKSERNYAQIEKEALSIIFGIKKFHQYLYGRKFLLVTDHKPLTSLLGPKSGIPTLAAARMQRWALLLSAYQYDIIYRSTDKHANADCLSRLPLEVLNHHADVDDATMINKLQIEAALGADHVRNATRADPILSKVLEYTLKGWPEIIESEAIKPYFNKRSEITTEDNCLLCGIRVIIPEILRDQVLTELHTGHPGIVRMKSLARRHVWWPGIDEDISKLVRSCSKCQTSRNKPPQAPFHPWDWPSKPWQRIHVDFAGPFLGKMFLLVVDSHSKWVEVEIMSNTVSGTTIEKLRDMFARFGLPKQLVSDNGPQFVSHEFSEFMRKNGVKHIRVTLYHPRSNGQAERFVRIFKQYFKAEGGGCIKQKLAQFLFSYRNTPNSTTGQTPAELMLNRRPRTRLDLLRPDIENKTLNKQADQKFKHDKHSKERDFLVGEPVLVQNFRGEPKWLKATIIERTSPVSYKTLVGEEVWRRHADQIRKRPYDGVQKSTANSQESNVAIPSTSESALVINTERSQTHERAPEAISESKQNATPSDALAEPSAGPLDPEPHARYPTRERKPPVRLGFDK